MKTLDNGKLLHHHLMYLVVVTKFSGKLKEQTHKARHAWMTIDEYKAKPKFPGNWALDYVLPSADFFVIEAERHMENSEFTDGKITKVEEFKK